MAIANAESLRLVDDGVAAPPARVPPHSDEAEMALLAALLQNNRAFERVEEFLRPEHFANRIHGRLFEAIGKLLAKGVVADQITLKQQFQEDGDLAEVGGWAYIMQISHSVVSIINAEDYGRTVHDLYLRRQLIDIGEEIVNGAFSSDFESDAAAQIEDAERQLTALAGDADGGADPVQAAEGLRELLEHIDLVAKAGGGIIGVGTGIGDLDRILGGMQEGDLIIIAGRPGMGKAQPLDARVKTPTGWKLMRELKIGDRLASPDGRPSRVTALHPQGEKDTVIVRFRDGRAVRCCLNHLWRVYSKHKKVWSTMTARELIRAFESKRNVGRLHIPLASGDWGRATELPIDPYLLGVLIGDGGLGQSVRFSTVDEPMLAAVTTRLDPGYVARPIGGCSYMIVRDRGVAARGTPNRYKEDLKALGVFGCRSYEKFIPLRYLAASRRQRVELLRGLMDTDGTVEASGTLRYCTVSTQLAKDVQALAWSLGAECKITPRSPSYNGPAGEKKRGRPAYVLSIRHPTPTELLTLPRKLARIPTRYQYADLRLRIESVEPAPPVECQCITVSHPEGLYVTEDFIVTHNSDLAGCIADNAARAGTGVAFFSLEMSRKQVLARSIARMTGIAASRQIKANPPLTGDEIERIVEASGRLGQVPLYIDDTAGLTVPQMRTRARRLKRKHGIGLIVVDYLQLMDAERGDRSDNRAQEVGKITKGLKTAARALGVPLIALSQLSRAVESRDDKRPHLEHLRESGTIEQDADVVGFVFRASYYLEKAEPHQRPEENGEKFEARHAIWEEQLARAAGKAEVYFDKVRFGSSGGTELAYAPAESRFSGLYREG